MVRSLPPFAAVRAFEAAARHLSFARAAEELCLSPSAISHQIRALELYLDTSLFERESSGIRLTLTGSAYAVRLTGLLDGLDSATRSAAATETPQTIRVLSTPGFAARWLVPRLGRFEHVDAVRLRVSVGAPSTDFVSNDADVVIQWADDPVPGCRVDPLMLSGRYPVAAPALLERHPIASPRDLLSVTLMHDETMDQWQEWFRLAGIQPPVLPRGPRYPNCELATTAVEQGQGVSLAYDHMVRETIAAGRLVRLFDDATAAFTIYAFVTEERRADEPLVRAFREFVFSEVSPDARPTPARRPPLAAFRTLRSAEIRQETV